MAFKLNLVSGVRKVSSRKGRNPATRLLAVLLILGGAFLGASSATAASIYWDGTATPASWNLNTNWSTASGATAPDPAAVPGASDDAIFNITTIMGPINITLDAAQAAKSLTFSYTGATTLTAGGTARTLTLGTGGITIASGAGAVTLGDGTATNDVLLSLASGNQAWTNSSTNAFTINNTVATVTRSAGATLNFNKASTGDFVMSTTVLPNNATTGIIGPWATFGTGTSTTYAANPSGTIVGLGYTGTTDGTTAATAANVIDTTGAVNYSVAAVGALGASANFNTLRYTGATGIITGPWTANGLMNVSGTALTFSGAGTIGTTNELIVNTANGGITLSAAVGNNGSNASALTKTGTGTLTLSTSNIYTGKTYINAGTLTVSNASALNGANGSGIMLAPGATLDLNAAKIDLTKLNPANGGSGVVAGSTVLVESTVGTGTGATIPGIVYGTVNFSVNGASATIAGMTFGQGSTLISNANSNNQFTSNLYLAGDATFQSGNITWEFDVPISPSTAGLKTLTFKSTAGAGNSHKIQSASGLIDGSGQLAVNIDNGASTLWINTAQYYSGGTNITSGIMLVDAGTAIGQATGAYVSFGPSSIGQLQLKGGSGTTLIGLNTASTGAIVTTAAAGTLTVNNPVANAYAGSLTTTTGALTLTKGGPGTLTFSGATRTYTGGTNVNAGTLLWSGGVNMPGTGTLTVNTGGNFSMADGTARNITSAAAVSLQGRSTVAFDWIGASADNLNSSVAATTAGNVGIIINAPSTTPTGSPVLLNAPSGLNTPTYYLANATNYTATLTSAANSLSIGSYASVTSPWASNNAYWIGGKITAAGAMAYSTGAATDTNWSSTDPGTSYTGVSVVPGSSNNLFFNASETNQSGIYLGADMTVNNVTINDNNVTAVNIGGGGASNYLTVLGGGVTVNSTATNPTISAGVVVGAPQTWTVASGKTLILSGVLAGANNNLQLASTNSLTIAGGGAVTLSGASNTYTGAITIDNATPGTTLKLTNAGAIGAGTGSALNVSSITVKGTGAALDVSATLSTNTEVFSGILTLNGIGIFGSGNALGGTTGGALMNSTSTAATYPGLVTLGGPTSIVSGYGGTTGNITLSNVGTILGSGYALTLDGLGTASAINSIISTGAGTVTKFGTGTWSLTSANTFTGAITVYGGTLALSGANATTGATAINGSTLSLSGAGSINGSTAIALNGGAITLTNTTTAEGSVNRISNSAAITSNGGTVNYTNTTGYIYAENIGTVALTAGQFNAALTTSMATGIQTLSLGLTHSGGSLNTSAATFSSASGLNALTNRIQVSGATATPAGQIVGPWATVGTSASVQTDYAVYDVSGNVLAANIASALAPSADSTWTDPTKAYTTSFLGGIAQNGLAATAHNMAALRNYPAFGGAATATTIYIPTNGNLNTYGLLNASTSLWTINQVTGSTGALSTPTGGGDLYINTGAGAITINAPINDNGSAVSVVKTGSAGNLTLNMGANNAATSNLVPAYVTNTYTGATVIDAGTLILNTVAAATGGNNTGALADGGVGSSLGAASTDAANLIFNGGTLQYARAISSTGIALTSTNRLFSVGLAGGTIDSSAVTTAANTMSFLGTGAMGFAGQSGPRTLTLQGSNAGYGSGSNLSYSTIALLIGDNGAPTSVTKLGTGTWALTNPASTYAGPTTVTAGVLDVATFAKVNTASSIGKGSASPGSAADIILNGGGLQYSNFAAAASTDRLFSVGTGGGFISSSAVNLANLSDTLSFTGTGAMGFNAQSVARTLTLQGTNQGANSMGLLIGDFGGATDLYKAGTGTWILANPNNTYTGYNNGNGYDGATVIKGGILSVSKLANGGLPSSIGASSNNSQNLGFWGDNSSLGVGVGGLLRAITPISTGTGSNAPILQYTGIGDSTDRLINFGCGGNDSKFAVIDSSGGGALNFTNTGSPTFVSLDKKFTLVFAGSNANNNTFALALKNDGTAGFSVFKTGTGTWILSGNNTYSNLTNDFGTTVQNGTLIITGSMGNTPLNVVGGTLQAGNGSIGSVNSGSTLNFGYANGQGGVGTFNFNEAAGASQSLGALTFTSGEGTVLSTAAGASSAATLTFSSVAARTAGATGNFALAVNTSSTGGTPNKIVLTQFPTGTTTPTAVLLDKGLFFGGSSYAAYDTGGYVRAYGSTDGSYLAAPTNSTIGASSATSNVDLTTGDITAQTTVSANTINMHGYNLTMSATTQTLSTNGILSSGAAAATLGSTGGILTTATASTDLVVRVNGSTDKLTIGSAIVNNTATALTKAGAGTLVLTGANTYTGTTYVDGGTLEFGGNNSTLRNMVIAQGATLKFSSTASVGSYNGTSATLSGLGNLVWASSNVFQAGDTGPLDGTNFFGTITISNGVFGAYGGSVNKFNNAKVVLDGGTWAASVGSDLSNCTQAFTLSPNGGTLMEAVHNTNQSNFTSTTPFAFTGTGNRTLKLISGGTNWSTPPTTIAPVNDLFNVFPVTYLATPLGDADPTTGKTSLQVGAATSSTWALSGVNTYSGKTTVTGNSFLSIATRASLGGGNLGAFVPDDGTTGIHVDSGSALVVGVGPGPTYFTASDIATILDGSHLGASTSGTGLMPGSVFGFDTGAALVGGLPTIAAGTGVTGVKTGTGLVFTYSGTLGNLSGGNNFGFAKYGAGTVILSGNNTYSGPTNVYVDAWSANSSILQAGSSTAFGDGSATNILTLFVGQNSPPSAIVNLFGNNITVGGIATGGGGTSTLNVIQSGSSVAGTDTLTVNYNGSTVDTFSGLLQNGGTRKLGLTKSGTGTLNLSNANTYTGGTTISAGILQLGVAQATGASSNNVITFDANSTGILRLNGCNPTVTGLNSSSGLTLGTPIVEGDATGSGLILAPPLGTTSSYSGVIRDNNGVLTGSMYLSMSGPGTQILLGNLSNTNNTTAISGGILILGGDNHLAAAVTMTGGIVQFNQPLSINGTSANVTIGSGATVEFGPNFDILSGVTIGTALSTRVVNTSAGAIAADNYASTNFNFSNATVGGIAGANLTAASLGAVGNVNYTGTYTPNATGGYRLGGGGGTLTYPTAITGGGNALTISGPGMVVLSNAGNSYGGNTTIHGGTLTLSGGNNRLPTGTALFFDGGTVTPTLDLGGNTQTVASISISSGIIQNGTIISNGGISFGGSGIQPTITASLSGAGTMTQNGGGTSPTLNANNSGYSGAINISAGNLKAVNPGSLGTGLVTLSGGALQLLNDGTSTGNGNGKTESISYGNAVTVSGNAGITVGQYTASVGTLNAANKTMQLGTLSISAQTLTVTNNNGFGLEFTGVTMLTGSPTINVATASASTQVPGLTLDSVTSGLGSPTGNGDTILAKWGLGTLVLKGNNTGFGDYGGGTNQIINITAGMLEAASDAALGAPDNIIRIYTNVATQGFRASGTFSTSRKFLLANTNNGIDVTQGNTLTLTSTFAYSLASYPLQKNDNGILEISADNNSSGYTGPITVAAGAIRVSNAGALGTTTGNTTVSNNVGAAVQLNALTLDTLTVAEPFNISSTGINTGGALQAIGGTLATPRSISTSGVITLGNAATIGADAYTTLNIGTSSMVGTAALTLAGAGTINISTAMPALTSITKIGGGTVDLRADSSAAFVGGLTVNAGTFQLDSTGKLGITGAVSVTPSGTLILDNSNVTNVNHRLNTRPVTLSGANLTVKPLQAASATVTETIGILTLNAGQSVITLTADTTTDATPATANQLNFTAASLATRVAGSTALIRGSSLGTATGNGISTFTLTAAPTFIGTTTALGTPTGQGILPYVIVDTTDSGSGSSFATTTAAAAILRPLAAGEMTAANAFTAASNVLLSANAGTVAASTVTTTINSLTMNNAASAVTMAPGGILTLSSGGLLNTVASGGVSGGYLNGTPVGLELAFHALGNLTVSSVIGNTGSTYTGGLTKAGAGNLTLSALNNYTGTTTINQGTLTLSGSDNTLAVGKAMIVNNGATLALGANNQYVGALSSTGTVENTGGNITGTGILTSNGATSNFAGNIGSDRGALNFIKAGAGILTLYSAQSTTGNISVIGGGLTLKDGGTLLGLTSANSIALKNATLTIDNTGTKDMADRVANAVPITLDGGTITYNGRAQYNSTESLGALTLNSGINTINLNVGLTTGVTSAQLTVDSYTRNTGAMLYMPQPNGPNLGLIGSNPRLVVAGTAPTMINGIVPGVYSVQGDGSQSTAYRMVSYQPGLGFVQAGSAGAPSETQNALATCLPTDNVIGANMAVKAGGQTINSLSYTSQAGNPVSFTNASDLLTVSTGNMFFCRTGSQTVGASAAVRGQLTSGSGELFMLVNGIAMTVNSVVVDNGSTPEALVLGFLSNVTTTLTANNTHTGGTFVNGGTGVGAVQGIVSLTTTNPGDIAIPYSSGNGDAGAHGLVIHNATVTMSTNAGQIDPSNTVTLNGGSTMTYVGNNTQANLVFNSNGGTSTPTVGGFNILTLTGSITSTPSNVAVVPTISGTALDLNNSTSHSITVDGGATTASLFNAGNGATVTGLTISSIINSLTPASGGFTKLGTGVLELSGANVFTGGLNINAGAVKATTSGNAIGGNGNVVTINNNAALWLNTTVNGGQTIVIGSTNGTIASLGDNTLSDNIILNGALTVSLADPTLNNTDRQITIGTTNTITGTGSLTVTGNVNNAFNASKMLLLTNANTFTNTFSGGLTIGSGGRVKPSAAYNIGSTSGSLTVNTGGVLDMNAKDQMVGNFTGTGGQVLGGTAVLTIGNGNGTDGNYAGVISTAISLVKIGTGTITLSGANTYTGSTTASGGTLKLDFNSTGAPLTNIISASSPLTLGGGNLTIQGKGSATNTQALFSTTANANSTLTLAQNGATSLDVNLAGLAFTGGAGINFAGATGTATGARFITSSSAGSNNGLTRLGGGSMWDGTGWASITTASAVNYVTSWAGTYTDIYTGTGGGSIVVPNTAAAEVRIQEGGSAGAPNTLAAATTTINSLLMSAATTSSTINMTGSTLTVGNGASAAGAIAVAYGAQGLTIGQTANEGFLTAGISGASTLDLNTQNVAAAQGIVVNSIIKNNAGAGAVSISAGGAGGKVTLNGTNTYTGTTAIGNGTLEIGGAGQLQSGNYAGAIQIGGDGTFKYNSSAAQTLSGAMTGDGALLISGGILTLSQVAYANTFNGGTIVSGNGTVLNVGSADGQLRGTLTINSGAKVSLSGGFGYASPATTVSVININGSTLDRTGASNATFTGITVNMTGGTWSGAVANANGPAIYDLFNGANGTNLTNQAFPNAGINTFASSTTSVISGNLALRSYSPVFTVAAGSVPAGGPDLLVSGMIPTESSGNGIIKAGGGIMAITSNNTITQKYGDGGIYSGYDGTTLINAGTLQLGNNTTTGSLNPNSPIVNNATLAFNRSNTLTQGTDFASVISGSGGIAQVGSGTTTLNVANNYTGTTIIRAGSLVAGANAPVSINGAFGNAASAIVLGDGSTGASDAPSLLVNGAFTVARDVTVGSVANTAAYNATIGGSNASGTATYTGNITLNPTAANYTATLQAAAGGTTEFKTGIWLTNNKAIAIGSAGNTGTVKLSNNLDTTAAVNVNYGTFTVNSNLTGGGTALTVAGGATLSGSGTINKPVIVTGGTSPSTYGSINLVDGSIGTLNLGSTLGLGGTGINYSLLSLEYGSAGFDSIIASGALTLGNGGVSVHLPATGLGTVPINTYTILNVPSGLTDGYFKFDNGNTSQNIGSQKFTLQTSGGLEQIVVTGLPVIGQITATAPGIIFGNSNTGFSFTVQNTGSLQLSFTGTAGTNVTGGPVYGSADSGGTSISITGLSFNGGSFGLSQSGAFSVSDPNAANSPQTGIVTFNVYNHSTPALTVASGNNQSVIINNSLSAATLTLSNTTNTIGGTPAPLDVSALSNLTGSIGSGVVSSGGALTYTATGFVTSTVGVNKSLSVGLDAGDQQTITGASGLSPLSTSFTYSVYNHSASTLTVASGNNQSVIIGNSLPEPATATLANTAGTTPAPLDVNTLSNLTGSIGSGVVSSGGALTYTATGFVTSSVGINKPLSVSLKAGDQQTITGAAALATRNTSFTYNVYNHSASTLTIAGGNSQEIITGGTLAAVTLTLSNTTNDTPAPLDVNTLSNLTGSIGSGVVSSGGALTYTATGFVTSSVGINKSLPVSLNAGDQQTITGAADLATKNANVIYTVYDHVSGSIVETNSTSGTIGLPPVHAGYKGSVVPSTSVSVFNYLNPSLSRGINLKTTGGTVSGDVTINNVSGVAPSTSQAIGGVTLSGSQSLGLLSNSFTQTVADDSSLPGFSIDRGSLTITVTGLVYSGSSAWTPNSGNSWGTLNSGFGANWGKDQGSPGLDAGFKQSDTAIFETAGGTVNLDGASPSLKALIFSNTTNSFTLAQGSGGTLTLNGDSSPATVSVTGIHTISAPINLAISGGSVTTTNLADSLTLSGNVGGEGALTKAGDGTLFLTGANNTYTGKTSINGGTLSANSLPLSNASNGIAFNSGVLEFTGPSGNVYLDGASVSDFAINVTNAGNLTVAQGCANAIVKGGGGTLTIANTGTQNGGDLTVNQGTVILSGSNSGTAFNVFNVNDVASGATVKLGNANSGQVNSACSFTMSGGTFDLNGKVGAQVPAISGSGTITNSSTTPGSIAFMINGLQTFSGNIVDGAGTVAVNLVAGEDTDAGTGTWTLSGSNTYSGATTISSGILNLSSPGSMGATAVTVNAAAKAALNVSGNYTLGTASGGSLIVSGGAAGSQGVLSLMDSTVNTLTLANNTAATTFTVGSNTNGQNSVLNMEVGATADKIALAGNAKISIGISTTPNVVNLTGLGSLDGTTQTLIDSPGGIAAGDFTSFDLVTTGNFNGYTLALSTATPNKLNLTETANSISGAAYWKGTNDGVWNSFSEGNTNTSNFATDVDGSTNATGKVNSSSDVHFSATSNVNSANTTLGEDFTIRTLSFDSTATSAVSIGGSNTLTIKPTASTDGISVHTDSANHTLSTKVALGADQTWTVGANRTLTASNQVSGDFALTKAGAGTLTLSGTNTYSGPTTVSAGTLKLAPTVANGNNINNSSAIAINGGATLDLTGLDSNTLVLNQPIKAYGQNTATITGAVNAGSQTIDLQDRVNLGTLSISSSLALNGGTLKFDLGNIGLLNDKLAITGAANLSGGMTTINVNYLTGLSTLLATPYTLITASGGLVSANFTLGDVTSLTLANGKNYTLALSGDPTHEYLTATEVSSANPTTYTLGATASATKIHVGGSSTITATITNTGPSGNSADTLNYTGLNVTGGVATGVSLPKSGGPLANNSVGTDSGTATFTPSAAGPTIFTPAVTTATNATQGGSATPGTNTPITVTAYRLATVNAITTPVTLTNVHVGGTFGTSALSIQNTQTNADSYSEKLDASFGSLTGSASTSGSISLLTPQGIDSSMTVGLGGSANTATAGLKTGSVVVNLLSNGDGTSGLSTSSLAANGSQTITVNGSVYSGKAEWAAVAGSGSWSLNDNWSDTQGNNAAGTPGVGGYAGDTATFGSTNVSSSAAITLDTPVIVAAISFSNTGGFYKLIGSGSNTLTLSNTTSTIANIELRSSSGSTNIIDAPVILNNNLSVTGSGILAFGLASSISDISGGTSSLTMNGTGKLILSGTDTYAGGTIVNSGTVVQTSRLSLPENHSLTIGAGAKFIYDPGQFVAGRIEFAPSSFLTSSDLASPLSSFLTSPVSAGPISMSSPINPVPEPSTLALLVAGVVVGFGVWRRKRK